MKNVILVTVFLVITLVRTKLINVYGAR